VEGTPRRGMAAGQSYPSLEALLKLEASLKQHLCAQQTSQQAGDEVRRVRGSSPLLSTSRLMRLRKFARPWYPRLRKFAVVGGTLGGLVFLALFALWWRLSSGPIELDIATPWLTAAIKENFGPGHEVEIGGTQIERDANKRRTSLRIRDIVVRDADGTVVASAPKAEVGISGASLLAGRIRAERLSLVGAEMAVRIESDSKVTVFAGSNKRPFVTASATLTPAVSRSPLPPAVSGFPLPAAKVDHASEAATAAPVVGAAPAANAGATIRNGVPDLAALLAWIDGLDASGLDGRDLTEIGLQDGNLTVDDQRN